MTSLSIISGYIPFSRQMSENTFMTEARRCAAFSAVKTPSSCRSLILLRSETARLNVAARRGGSGAKSKRSHTLCAEPFDSLLKARTFVAPSSGKTKAAPLSLTAMSRAENTRPERFVHVSAPRKAAETRHRIKRTAFISCRPPGRSPTPPRRCAAHRSSAHDLYRHTSRNPTPRQPFSMSAQAPRRHSLRATH